MSPWPHDDTASLIAFYGDPRRPGFAKNLVLVVPPWPMTYEGRPIRGVQIHRKCADSLKAVFDDIAEQVGHDWSKLPPGAVKFSGSYNYRPVRGSSLRLSCHAFGAAIDLDAEANPMNTDHESAMSDIVIDAFKRQGWFWGGDFHSRQDPMHFQAANEASGIASLVSDLTIAGTADAAEMPPMTDAHEQTGEEDKPQATIEELPPPDDDPPAPEAEPPERPAAAAKPLFKSKITWAQIATACAGFFGLGSQADLSFMDKLKAVVTSPGFAVLVMLICVGLTVYWRWRDHGRGANR